MKKSTPIPAPPSAELRESLEVQVKGIRDALAAHQKQIDDTSTLAGRLETWRAEVADFEGHGDLGDEAAFTKIIARKAQIEIGEKRLAARDETHAQSLRRLRSLAYGAAQLLEGMSAVQYKAQVAELAGKMRAAYSSDEQAAQEASRSPLVQNTVSFFRRQYGGMQDGVAGSTAALEALEAVLKGELPVTA